jgi:hypothetical protein
MAVFSKAIVVYIEIPSCNELSLSISMCDYFIYKVCPMAPALLFCMAFRTFACSLGASLTRICSLSLAHLAANNMNIVFRCPFSVNCSQQGQVEHKTCRNNQGCSISKFNLDLYLCIEAISTLLSSRTYRT